MGKYDAVMKKLKPVPIELREGGTKYQEKVDAEKNRPRSHATQPLRGSLDEVKKALERFAEAPDGTGAPLLALEYRLLYDLEEAAETLAKATRLQMEARAQLLLDAFEADGVTSLKLADGATLRQQPEPYATTKDPEGDEKTAENEAALNAWLKKEGLEYLLKPNWSTINSMTKEALVTAGGVIPDGVNVYFKNKIVCTR